MIHIISFNKILAPKLKATPKAIFYDLFKDKLCSTNAVIDVDAADPTVHIDVLQRKIVVHVHLGVTVVTTVDRKERVVDV